jgi:2-succinyl-6-hydroxy-2,4-cyclohexadiene-1-carboxylate synthase
MRVELPDGLYLNVEVSGEGQPLVLLHGFMGSAENWKSFVEAGSRRRMDLGAETAPVRFVAVDLLGHGHSACPSDPARYQMERLVEDLRFVFTTLGLKAVTLLGYSMGGRVALSFALAHPEFLRALILESASPGLADPVERAERVKNDEALARKIETGGIEKFVDDWERLPLFASQARLPESVRAEIRTGRLRNNPIGLANSLRGTSTGVQTENWSRLPELKLPTLILAGSLDQKFLTIGQQMAAQISNSRLEVVEAGHTIHLENPAEFSRLVENFLKGNKS